MINHANPAKKEQRDGGFTLIEVLVVVAILGIMTGLAMVAYETVGRRGALQNAAFDLQGVLSTARTRASSRSHPVWVVFYPSANREALVGGAGAFMVVEDRDSAYTRTPYLLFTMPLEAPGLSGDVSSVYFLDDYSKKVRFQALKPGSTELFGAPFSKLAVQTCSFCSGADLQSGAIGFYPDGGARFVNGEGEFLSATNQSLALSGVDGLNEYLFAISGPSGYMATFSPDPH